MKVIKSGKQDGTASPIASLQASSANSSAGDTSQRFGGIRERLSAHARRTTSTMGITDVREE